MLISNKISHKSYRYQTKFMINISSSRSKLHLFASNQCLLQPSLKHINECIHVFLERHCNLHTAFLLPSCNYHITTLLIDTNASNPGVPHPKSVPFKFSPFEPTQQTFKPLNDAKFVVSFSWPLLFSISVFLCARSLQQYHRCP